MNKRYVAVERFYRSKILAQMTILITFFFPNETNFFILFK